MLQISHTTMGAFEQQRYAALAGRIDRWLGQVVPQWAGNQPAIRRDQLDRMMAHGRRSGMKVERDFAVFAWICVTLGPDWPQRLGDRDLDAMLANPEWTAEAKLMALDTHFGLSGAPA